MEPEILSRDHGRGVGQFGQAQGGIRGAPIGELGIIRIHYARAIIIHAAFERDEVVGVGRLVPQCMAVSFSGGCAVAGSPWLSALSKPKVNRTTSTS